MPRDTRALPILSYAGARTSTNVWRNSLNSRKRAQVRDHRRRVIGRQVLVRGKGHRRREFVAVARDAWPFTSSFMHRLGDGLEIAGVPLT